MLKKVDILPPKKGFVEALSYADQPVDSSPDSLNVMPIDPFSEKFRIAQRFGDGKVDFFNFNTNQTVNGMTDGNPIINLPDRGCYTVTTNVQNLDINISGGTPTDNGGVTICGPTTVEFDPPPGSPDDPDNTSHGTITITHGSGSGGSGPGSFPFHGPPSGPDDGGTHDNPARPWLSMKKCSDDTFTGFWIHQDILAIHGALPALLDIVPTSATYNECLKVTGQRATDAQITGDLRRSASDFTVFLTCTACTSPSNLYGWWKYTTVYDCVARTWGPITGPVKRCVAVDAVGDAQNVWAFDGNTSGTTRTYDIYVSSNETCATTADFDDTPGVLTYNDMVTKYNTLILGTPDTCADIIVKLYRTSTGVLLHTYGLTRIQDWSYQGASFGGFNGEPFCALYSAAPICGDSPGSWYFEDLGYADHFGGIGYFHLATSTPSAVPVNQTLNQCTSLQNSDMYVTVEAP